MPRPALVPIPDLAVAYVHAVECGQSPYKVWREEFGLSTKQVDKRAWKLRQSGWLPPGSSRAENWLTLAKAILDERLAWMAERERIQDERLDRRLRILRAQLKREQVQPLPAQYRPHKKPPQPANGSVLDLFW